MNFDLGSILKLAAMAALTAGTGGAAGPLMGAEATGGGGIFSSILGGLGGAAAPTAALPAATAGTGIASASPELLNAVGLPDLAGGAGATPAAGGFNLGDILKTGGQALDVAGKAKQLTAPSVAPPSPSGTGSGVSNAGAAPAVNFSGGSDDAYASQLQKILKQHTSSGMGGGY